MKILHILAQLPTKTGSGVYFSNLIREFHKYGENYAIFGLDKTMDYSFKNLPKEKTYPVTFMHGDLNFPIVGMSDVMPYNSTRYRDMTEDMIKIWQKHFKNQIIKAYEEIKPDIIICHHLFMLTSLVLDLLSDKDLKIIGICHGTDIRQSIQNVHLKEKYLNNMDKLDFVFSLSDDQIDEINLLFNIPKKKIFTTGGGYNQEYFYRDDEYKYEANNNFVNIVFAGKISNAKGVYELIDAFKSLNYGTDIILNIIGTPIGEDKKRIENAIKDTKNIKIFNAKNQSSLADMLRYSDIFVLPSYYEGLGLVAIEALASGCFVVSTDLKPLKEVLGKKVNNSNAIEYCAMPKLKNVDTPLEEEIPQHIENLARAISKQVERVKKNERINPFIYDDIKIHSWKNIADRMYNIILNH
ncbi:MAG: glycosyltransferase family 4 protein [Lagierella massiliensis]|nr:glycosyltransferase family 4 protein [Lagierella massiliensis]